MVKLLEIKFYIETFVNNIVFLLLRAFISLATAKQNKSSVSVSFRLITLYPRSCNSGRMKIMYYESLRPPQKEPVATPKHMNCEMAFMINIILKE